MKQERVLNKCFCGNPFPYGFSKDWERLEKNGRYYARCSMSACGHVTEAFRHRRQIFWIWPQISEALDPALLQWLTGYKGQTHPLAENFSDQQKSHGLETIRIMRL